MYLCAMLNQKRICIVLPAYNAAETLEMTYNEIPFDIVDEVVLVDDAVGIIRLKLPKSWEYNT